MWYTLLASEEAAKLSWRVLSKKATHRVYGNPQNQDDASRGDNGCLQKPLQSSARRSLPLENLTLTVTRKNFVNIPDTLIYWRRNIQFIVEELVLWRRPEHLFKAYPSRKQHQGNSGNREDCQSHRWSQ